MNQIRRTKNGRGVFAGHTICRGETIEVCHMLVSDVGHGADHPFDKWAYEFDGKAAVALGNGSLYNHSYDANATWVCRSRTKTIRIYAIKTVHIGDEITINYSGETEPGIDLGFVVRK